METSAFADCATCSEIGLDGLDATLPFACACYNVYGRYGSLGILNIGKLVVCRRSVLKVPEAKRIIRCIGIVHARSHFVVVERTVKELHIIYYAIDGSCLVTTLTNEEPASVATRPIVTWVLVNSRQSRARLRAKLPA